MPTSHIRRTILDDVERKEEENAVLKAGKFTDMFGGFSICIMSITAALNWFSNVCCYYGTAQYIGSLGSNLYLNFAVSALIQQPSVLFLLYTLSAWGRKWTLIFSHSLACVSAICTIFMPAEEYKIIPAAIGMFALGKIL